MTDFFDDDLERVKRREPTGNISLGPGSKSIEEASRFEGIQEGGDLNLTQMKHHKEQVEDQVATAMKELERLRQRQEDLQHQKSDLEEIRKKQSLFDSGRREVLDTLSENLVGLEKDELKAEQLVELLSKSRKQYKNWARELDQLNDQNWDQDKYRTELNAALTRIEETRTEFKRTEGKIESLMGEFGQGVPASDSPAVRTSQASSSSMPALDFLSALKVGAGFTLPITVALLLILLVHYLLTIGAL